ncbi:hypothetical protein ACTSEZ_17540 [Metabacillus sp. JX24]|uniref:hypothetical protein n=1 Tax=Metabacillus sp. JX24 TaxID=3240759 RepID=UPI00350FF4FF
MSFIDLKSIIFDSNLIIAVIAINMTIIGLTSLAETKKIIGIDYGKFLVKKYRIFNLFRVYEMLVVFAIINVFSLFLMFVETFEFRLINSVFLMISLVFAIYYFFAYIISENKLVKNQIYEDEIKGLYYESDNFDHQEADVLTKMTGGSRTSKKLSSNVISYFNTYNSESQLAFEEIFGRDSLLYDYSKKSRRKLKKKYNISPYIYRNNSKGIHDISYEFFQLFRHSDQQDKWAIEILRIFDGDRLICKKYEILRLFNFTRVITHLNLFGNNDNLFKYKFLEYVIIFFYNAVLIEGDEISNLPYKDMIEEVESYTFNQLLQFMFNDEHNQKDSTFTLAAKKIIEEILLKEKYKGILKNQDLIILFLNKTLEIDNQYMKDLFAEILDKFYEKNRGEEIPGMLKIENIKTYITEYRQRNRVTVSVTTEEIFG